MRWITITVLAGLVAAGACTPDQASASRAAKPHPAQVCENALQSEFDAGLESRTVVAGPASMVAFPRLNTVPSGSSPARYFKLQIRLEPGTDATVRTKTRRTALMFDRTDIHPDEIYRLRDGAKRVRFSSCPDRPAVFVGSVLTTGPRIVDLEVASGGKRFPARVSSVSPEGATP
jgi:hypothetical protein